MSLNEVEPAVSEAKKAKVAANSAANYAERSFAEAAALGRTAVTDGLRRAEQTLTETLATVRDQSRQYIDSAGQHIGEARAYATDRIRERPLTATLAGVGVGVLLGLLLASRHDRHDRYDRR